MKAVNTRRRAGACTNGHDVANVHNLCQECEAPVAADERKFLRDLRDRLGPTPRACRSDRVRPRDGLRRRGRRVGLESAVWESRSHRWLQSSKAAKAPAESKHPPLSARALRHVL